MFEPQNTNFTSHYILKYYPASAGFLGDITQDV